jgi:putative transposase
MRKFEFQTGEFYHIYNRGVDKRDVFIDEKDYVRFLRSMRGFNNKSIYEERVYIKNRGATAKGPDPEASGSGPVFSKPLVEIICYCLNPNHYHFLLKQLAPDGIRRFMHKIGTGYVCYFNLKHKHSGYLFQGTYKAIHIETDSYLLWLSGYINGNAEIHKIAKAENWIWGSYLDYIGKRGGTLCHKETILSQFEDADEYKNLVRVIIKESGERKEELKKYLLE